MFRDGLGCNIKQMQIRVFFILITWHDWNWFKNSGSK